MHYSDKIKKPEYNFFMILLKAAFIAAMLFKFIQ